MSTNMNLNLGLDDIEACKQTLQVGSRIVFVLIGIAALILINFPAFFALIFSSDPHYVEKSVEVAPLFVFVLISMVLSVTLESVLISFGRTGDMFKLGFVASWLVQVPAVYLVLVYVSFSLGGLYVGVALGYIALAFLYGRQIMTVDWEEVVAEAHERVHGKASAEEKTEEEDEKV